MSNKELMDQIAALQAENQALKAKKNLPVTFKVTEKGGLSVYGLGRFPVTLYKSQWVKLISAIDSLKAFMVEHDKELKDKTTVTATIKAA